MAEYNYERTWVADKKHWDTDYPGASPSLVEAVAAAIGKTPRRRCAGEVCTLIFDAALTPGEEATVASEVATFKANAQTANAKVYKPREEIMSELLESCEPVTQLPRCIAALDKNATFIAALDNDNWPLARSRAAAAVTAGDLTQVDYDLIDSILPE